MNGRARARKIHQGMVLIGDGSGKGRPYRLELTKDALVVQAPVEPDEVDDDDSRRLGSIDVNDFDTGTRTVVLRRNADGGLGLSLKGGADVSPDMPVMVSRLANPSYMVTSNELYVGDAIVEINGRPAGRCTHDQVVQMLRDAGDTVRLAVRHCGTMAPYLRAGESAGRERSASARPFASRADGAGNTGTWKSSLKSPSGEPPDSSSASAAGSAQLGSAERLDDAPEGFRTVRRLPLPMAHVSKYLSGTDKLRHNAFELRAVDGGTTGVVYCEDGRALHEWLRLLHSHIAALNHKSIKMSNKCLHPSEAITYLGWVAERQEGGVHGQLAHKWEPRFLILKGDDVCLFESPPLEAADLSKCVHSHKIYETLYRETTADERVDARDQSFVLEAGTSSGRFAHYLSAEAENQPAEIEAAYNRALFAGVQRAQKRTFACGFNGRPSGLTIDNHKGFMLYDIQNKVYVWQYPFSSLVTSCDDGKMRVQLTFRNPDPEMEHDVWDLDCTELYSLVYTMHGFYLAKIIGSEPEFLATLKKV